MILPIFFVMATSALAQTARIGALYDRLVQPSETDAAAAEIAKMAEADPVARTYLADRLPSLIGSGPKGVTGDPVWGNAVRLSGQLKIAASVPALGLALSKPNTAVAGGYDNKYTGAYTFTIGARLAYDIIGRALADIGDSSVPVVANILKTGDFNAKRRAYLVLINIDTPAAEKALQDALPAENDPTMARLIKSHLENPDADRRALHPQQ